MYQNVGKWMNFQKFQWKWKIVKHYIRVKQQAAFRKLLNLSPTPPPNQIKSYYVFGTEMVQYKCLFWHQTEKFLKWERFSAMLRKYIIFNVKLIEVHKMSEVLWAKLYCKMSELLRWFLLALRLSASKLKKKKKLWLYPLKRVEEYKKVVCPKLK